MVLTRYLRGVLAAALFVTPALSFADIIVSDPYARASRPNAPTGAAFMVIENDGTSADRLVGVRSDIAKRVELHTHIDQGDGVMKMTEIEGGIEIAAGGSHVMKRGGDHVMFMGLNTSLEQDAMVEVTFIFENAGEVSVSIPVDNARQPDHDTMQHGDTN